MKKLLFLLLSLSFVISGCVVINLPKVEPLAEKSIGGSGADKVVIIDISGIITDHDEGPHMMFEKGPGMLARVKEELDKAAKDNHVRAIVLRINSPGGSVTTCDILNHEINEFRKSHKGVAVVAELMDVAASGGYYVAVASDRIVAHPTTVTGSIGVVAFSVNATGLMDKIGITNQTIKSADKKDMGSPLRQMTSEEREILQSIIESMYGRFLDAVAAGRPELAKLSRDELKKIADGRVYSADQAVSLKLADRIGYLDDAVTLARELAGIKEATVVTYSRPRAYKNNIYSLFERDVPATVNLVNIDAGALTERSGMRFMYLWMP